MHYQFKAPIIYTGLHVFVYVIEMQAKPSQEFENLRSAFAGDFAAYRQEQQVPHGRRAVEGARRAAPAPDPLEPGPLCPMSTAMRTPQDDEH